MDDWEDAALSSRHMHNRVGRSGGKGSGKFNRNSVFDVRKTFGTYSCKCPAWHRMSSAYGHSSDKGAALELYRLTENGQGVVGQLFLPGVLQAALILAGSRDCLQRIISELEQDNLGNHTEVEEGKLETRTDSDDNRDGSDHDSGNWPEYGVGSDRFDTFEKNSFRSPKFWLQWNGILQPTSTWSLERAEAGLGYIVFTSKDCRKFQGTLNCASLGWKDVSFSGHRVVSRSESDLPVAWGVDRMSV